MDPKQEVDLTIEMDPKQEVDLTIEMDPKQEVNRESNKKSIWKKIKKIIKYIFITIFVLLLLYIIFNFICSIYEKSQVKSYHYGTTVKVDGHNMIADIVGENNEPTIIFLTGLTMPSPKIFYKPLTELLSKKYKVITIEPLSYGLSDIVDKERTIDNIASELHSCIEQLNLKNYYLMSHSIGGMYSIYYANKYPDEVSGFIGFDATVSKTDDFAKEEIANYGTLINVLNLVNVLGINRIKSIINKRNMIIPLHSDYNYTDEEIKMYRNIQLVNGFNKSIKNEVENFTNNLNTIHDMKFPKHTSVLNYVSSGNCKIYPVFKQYHLNVGSESISNEVIELSGNHAFHLFQHNDEILEKLDTFIKK